MSNTRFSTDEIPDLQGKVVIVTGGNVVSKASRRRLCDSNERTTKANPAERPPLPPPILSSNQGIGLETVKQLALKHAKVYLCSRTQSKAETAIEALQKENAGLDIKFQKLDLDDLQGVKEAVEEIKSKEDKINILICNAGVMGCPYSTTKDGYEVQFQSNHLGHFLFVTGLKTLLENGGKGGSPSRVVNLSSAGHRFGGCFGFTWLDFTSKASVNRTFGPIPVVDSYFRYGQAKTCNILFAREINERWDPTLVRALSLHPGVVSSNLYRHSILSPVTKYIMIGTKDGALSTLKCATDPKIEKEESWDQFRGTYGLNQSQSAFTQSSKLQEDLWNLSEAFTREFQTS